MMLQSTSSIPQTVNFHLAALMPKKVKVPVLYQLSQTECGAACLAMILGYYGHHVSVNQCREQIGIGRDGATAKDLVDAARKYRLDAQGVGIQDVSQFSFVNLPAILYWDARHFVVLERISNKHAWIVDPAAGRKQLDIGEFLKYFSGIALSFSPSPTFVKRNQEHRATWFYYLRYFLLDKSLIVYIGSVSIILQVLGLVLPFFTQVVVDKLIPRRADDLVTILTVGVIGVVIIQSLTRYIRSVFMSKLSTKIDSMMMTDFLKHLLSLPFKYFQDRRTGDLMMRMGSNSSLRDALTDNTVTVVIDVFLAVGFLVVLVTQSVYYTVIALFFAVVEGVLILLTSSRIRLLMQRNTQIRSNSNSYSVEILNGISTIKASGAENWVMDRWTKLFAEKLKFGMLNERVNAALNGVMETIRTITPYVFLWIGTQQIIDGQMSLGTMLALNSLVNSFLGPVGSLVSNINIFQEIRLDIERLSDVMLEKPEQKNAEKLAPITLKGNINLENVSFRYSANSQYVLKNISIAIQQGKKIAIVGPTGSGKTTLAKLLVGLYVPTSGEIYFDGRSVKQINLAEMRKQVGVVMQTPFLFSGTVQDNIVFNDLRISNERVEWACKVAEIHNEIMKMPMQYKTLLGEGGSGFSGGQSQRLMIARALVRKPQILLLDEATSNLDVETEGKVDAHLNYLKCTRVVIAHRLSTVKNADVILFMKDGEIVEQGSHKALMTLDGYYASFVNQQSHADILK